MDQVICPAVGAPDPKCPVCAGEAWDVCASGWAAAAGATAAPVAPIAASSRPPTRTLPRTELWREREMFIGAVGPFTTVSPGLPGVDDGARRSGRQPAPPAPCLASTSLLSVTGRK